MMIDAKGRRFLIGCCLLLAALTASAEGYRVAPPPQWASPAEIPRDKWVETAPGSNGEAYLLVDRQWSLLDGRLRQYNHFATKAMAASGVEEVSSISIDFDPLYESLSLHQLRVWRNGEASDRLSRARIDLIQREKELEYQLYDGSKTLHIILEDIRPGDTVEYSYTLEGSNPIFSGHFSETLNLQWRVPVGRLHYRVSWPDATPLHLRHYKTAIKPIRRHLGGEREAVWLRDRVDALFTDGDTPDWYDPFPKIEMSDLAQWSEVVDWALPLYGESPATPAETELVATIAGSASTPEQRLLAALDFVQEQIRYLGLEMGENSHRPSQPGEVLERRYGDCKDKARLLVGLLKAMGIEAYPALVNTDSGEFLPDALPSMQLFDHAIVMARLDGRNYWLDPTLTNQSGNLETLYQPDYDYALVVAPTGGGLRHMSEDIQVVHGKRVEEQFDISGGAEQPVDYRILTEVDHYYADTQRDQLAQTTLAAQQQSYLNYVAHYYPSVELAEDLRVTETSDENRIRLFEHYRIPNAWTPQSDTGYVVITFEPSLIDDHISSVESPKRTSPYAVTHPVRYEQVTRIHVPPDSSFENERYTIEDSAFHFEKTVDFDGSDLVIRYLYQSLRDHVMPADIEQHAQHLRDIYNLSSYQVRMTDPAIGFGEYRFDAGDLNTALLGWSLLTLALSGLLCYRFIYLPERRCGSLEGVDWNLSGVGGWLILPAIFLFVTPVSVAWSSADLLYLFSATQWSLLRDGVGTGMLALITLEVMVNLTLIVVSLFMIVMFVTKRCGFPRLMILFYLFVVTTSGADLLAVQLMGEPGIELAPGDVGEFVRQLLASLIWGSYFARSERVRATFVRSRNGKSPQWQGELATQGG